MERDPVMELGDFKEFKVPTEEINITFTENELSLGYGAINAPKMSFEFATERAEAMTHHFVYVDPKTPSDCIDGRHTLFLLDQSLVESPRASVAGGAGLTGYASAKLTHYFAVDQATIDAEFRYITDALETEENDTKPVIVGGHVDVDAYNTDFSEQKTGCGAADKFIENMSLLSKRAVTLRYTDGTQHTETIDEVDARLAAVTDLTKQVFETAGYYDVDTVDELVSNVIKEATQLVDEAVFADWNGIIMKDNLAEKGANRVTVLDTSDGGDTGVHGHTERKVLFNFKENTTFDQDGYFDSTKEKDGEGREIFDVDVWHIRDIANKLSEHENAGTSAESLFAGGIAFQIATYLGLCDGTHRAFFAQDATVTS